MKRVFLILSIAILVTCCVGPSTKSCEEPEEVYEYRMKNLKGFKIIDRNELRNDWRKFVDRNIACPTSIDFDFSNDGNKDFICMLKDSAGIPYLVAFNNYETANISYQVIDGVADYGNYGIGSIIYADKDTDGFYAHKMESSKAHIHWKDNQYQVEYLP